MCENDHVGEAVKPYLLSQVQDVAVCDKELQFIWVPISATYLDILN